MVTIKDIAKEAGVSYSTVSCVLNGKAKQVRISERSIEKVQAAADKLGYQRNEIARSIVTGKTHVIGFVVPEVASEHCARILEGVMDYTSQNNYFVKIIKVNEEDKPERIAGICSGHRLDGVICYELARVDFIEELHLFLTRKKIPMAIAGGSYSISKGIHITPNNKMGGALAFEHLYELGHRKFFIPFEHCGASWANERVEGFVNSARNMGIEISASHLPSFKESMKISIEQLQCIFSGEDRPTAVFCLSDYTALRMLTELSRVGIMVPEDVSLVGYGNFQFACSCTPQITSIEEQLVAIGERTVESLLAEIRASTYKSFYEEIAELFEVKLVARGSTAGLQ